MAPDAIPGSPEQTGAPAGAPVSSESVSKSTRGESLEPGLHSAHAGHLVRDREGVQHADAVGGHDPDLLRRIDVRFRPRLTGQDDAALGAVDVSGLADRAVEVARQPVGVMRNGDLPDADDDGYADCVDAETLGRSFAPLNFPLPAEPGQASA